MTSLAKNLTIREIRDDHFREAFAVIRQLRDHLGFKEFEARLKRQQRARYVLFGAFDREGNLRGVIGMRPLTTLARGDHLHVDDLVVDAGSRRMGVGRALMNFAEEWAMANGLGSVFLDSRAEVLQFYSALGYLPHTATLMRKRVVP